MFDRIAEDWRRKRTRPWKPFTKEFSTYFPLWYSHYIRNKITSPHPYSRPIADLIFIDVGSGSGRHSEFFRSYCKRLIELDESRKMLCENRRSEHAIRASMDNLPFRDGVFDGLTAVASYHHVHPRENRIKALHEINRILKPMGLVCITVWRFYQQRFKKVYIKHLHDSCSNSIPRPTPLIKTKDGYDILEQETGHDKKYGKTLSSKDKGKSKGIIFSGEVGDVLVPWTISNTNSTTVYRFYHLYRSGEFYGEMRIFSFIKIGPMGNKGDGSERPNLILIGMKKKGSS